MAIRSNTRSSWGHVPGIYKQHGISFKEPSWQGDEPSGASICM
nr:hypothetical protein [Candidatus Sigynarchaeum springense]